MLFRSEKSLVQYSSSTRDNNDVAVLKCLDSSIIFLNTTKHITPDYYSNKNDLSYWNMQTVYQARNETLSDDLRRAQFLEFHIAGKDWVDIGTGLGGILHLCKDKVKSLSAVEPQSYIKNIIRDEGFNVFSDITELEDYRYDVLSLFHVFEHISNPIPFLKEAQKKLKKSGVVVIEVPHAKDALLSLYESESFKKFTLWSEHLLLHTRESLKKFVEEAGFRVVSLQGIQRYSLANHLMWLAKNLPGGHKKWSQINSELLNNEYEKILENLDLTDTLLLVAKKN